MLRAHLRTLLLLTSFAAIAACDDKKDEAKSDAKAKADAKSGDAKAGDAKADAKTGDAKTGEAKTGDAKTGDAKADAKVEPTPSSATDDAAAWEAEQRAKWGSCKVDVSGSITKSFETAGGRSALGSDYFMNDQEIQEAVKFLSRGKSVEEAMKQDPRVYTLVVNCSGGGLNLNFLPSADSKYADVPFGPKKYELAGLMGNKPGFMTVMMSIDNKMLRREPGGHFEITKFDKTGLVANFAFKAKDEAGGAVDVKGTIDYRCAHDTALCREGRGEK